MSTSKSICDFCFKQNGEEVFLEEKNDSLICPRCKNCIFIHLEGHKKSWSINSEENFPFLRPELTNQDLPNPRLLFLYQDCYQTLLIGRYNASIVMMGVLLEVIMKERIELKLGEYFSKPFGPCLEKIERNKLMGQEHIFFLRKFKNTARNPYQHADEVDIMKGIYMPVWPVKFENEISAENMKKFIDDINSGKVKPKFLPVSDIPAIRSIAKQSYDRKKAIELFNEMHDFLIDAYRFYFKEWEFQEHHRKYGTGLEKVDHFNI
jgi:hypothetical protein